MKTLKNLKQVFESAGSQVTAQELLNGRLYLKNKGWSSVKISDELKESIISSIVETAGGRENTKVRMYAKLRNSKPQHWAIARFLLSRYDSVRNGEPYFSYCAGQDQTWEMKQLRNFLKA
jgi:hypothetical protein